MSSSEHRRLAEALRGLHRGPLLILPNAWDAFSAVLMETVGFKAIATTSAGVSWSLGYADGEKVLWHEMLAAVERIVGAVKVPVTADIEGGFASTTSDLIYRIEEVIGVGACGVNLEDGAGPTHQPRPIEEACERIAAARAFRARLPSRAAGRAHHRRPGRAGRSERGGPFGGDRLSAARSRAADGAGMTLTGSASRDRSVRVCAGYRRRRRT